MTDKGVEAELLRARLLISRAALEDLDSGSASQVSEV